MDFASMTLTALFAVGAANVVMMFWPTADSRVKFFVSFVAALIAYFIPADLQSIAANAVKEAIAAAIIGSGIYKVAQKAGGN